MSDQPYDMCCAKCNGAGVICICSEDVVSCPRLIGSYEDPVFGKMPKWDFSRPCEFSVTCPDCEGHGGFGGKEGLK